MVARRVVSDEAIHGGAPIIVGTRIPVAVVRGLHDAGLDAAAIIAELPALTEADVAAALEATAPGGESGDAV